MSARTAAAAAATLLAAAGALVLAGAQHPHPAHPEGHPQVRVVTAATLSCPGEAGSAGGTTSVFAVGPGRPAAPGGSARLAVSGSTTVATSAAGVALRGGLSGPSSRAGALVTAQGPLAAGVSGAQLTTYRGSTTSGIAAAWCLAPRAQWWFTGVDTSIGTTAHLVLANPSPSVALVDLRFLGPDGPVDAAGSHGLALAPQSREVLDLARFAPGRASLTLQVSAARGTVAAAVSTTSLAGLVPTGSEWVPPSGLPSRTVDVAAGVASAAQQRLVVSNPGPRQVLVAVRILDKGGAFTSSLLPSVQVPPGAVVVKDITAVTGRHATAVELSSSGPVTGAIESLRTGPVRDFSLSTAAEPLSAPAVVPTLPGTTLTLAFATDVPGEDDVRIDAVDRFGQRVATSTLQVRGGTTATWTPASATSVSYLLVTVPAGNPLAAVASYTGPAGIAQLPVLSGGWTVVHPAVVP